MKSLDQISVSKTTKDHNPRQQSRELEDLKTELDLFAKEQHLGGLQDRIRRGLNPVAILALKETGDEMKIVCEQLGADYNEVVNMAVSIQARGPWDYVDKMKDEGDPNVNAWVLMQALGQKRKMDITDNEFIAEVESVYDKLNKIKEEPVTFVRHARERVFVESQKEIRLENGVPITGVDDAYVTIATGGFHSGVVCDADGTVYSIAKEFNDDVFAIIGLVEKIEKDDRSDRMISFYYNKDGERVAKRKWPGFVVVLNNSIELAIAIAKGSAEVDEEVLAQKAYTPTSMEGESRTFGKIRKKHWVEETLVARGLDKPRAELNEQDRFREEFYLGYLRAKANQVFRDSANMVIRATVKKGEEVISDEFNRKLFALAEKSIDKQLQKIEEVKHMMSEMRESLASLRGSAKRVVDCAGGAGDLGLAVAMEMRLLGHSVEEVRVLELPGWVGDDYRRFNEMIIKELPESSWFTSIVRYDLKKLQEAKLPDDAVVVAKHACGDLTDSIILKWTTDSHSPFLCVMTCCQDKAAKRAAPYGISQTDWTQWCHESAKTNSPKPDVRQAGIDAMLHLDESRVSYLKRYGMQATLSTTDKFPKGDVICAVRGV
ncbi:MAG: methyltransferase [bacterium]|nr:methyltransferase [bacterium]